MSADWVAGITRMVVGGYTDSEIADLYGGEDAVISHVLVYYNADYEIAEYDDFTVGELILKIRREKGVPEPKGAGAASGDVWRAVRVAYERAQRAGSKRPSMLETAKQMGFDTEEPLRLRLRTLGIPDYRFVHERIAGEHAEA